MKRTYLNQLLLKIKKKNFQINKPTLFYCDDFVKTKVRKSLRLSDYPEVNKDVIQRQLIIIQDEVDELLQEVHSNQK